MENRIYNEKNGLWYELQGDYYLPCLTLPKQEEVEIGIWGQRRRQYLKQHHRVLYYNLLTSGKLNSHLAEIDKQAEEMFSRLVDQLAEQEGVTEKLKAENQMLWVQRMNNIRNRAKKIVSFTLIFAKPSCSTAENVPEDIPKKFWKYYDLYRRQKISLSEYTQKSGIPMRTIYQYLEVIREEKEET